MMQWDQKFIRQEYRSGFLVTEKRKKIWQVQVDLLQQFDDFCKKNHLKYYMEAGTLLGAVRHKGFIPWDDDVDVIMFRDDYEKMQQLAPSAFKEPYFLQNSYTDPMYGRLHSRLQNVETTAIQELYDGSDNYAYGGIFLDIFPMDDVKDGLGFPDKIHDMLMELLMIMYYPRYAPEKLKEYIARGNMAFPQEVFLELLHMDMVERQKVYESFCLEHFAKSTKGACHYCYLFESVPALEKSWYAETVELPFENLMLPAPAGYEHVLQTVYGNYKEFVISNEGRSVLFFDTDRPFSYYEMPENRRKIVIGEKL